MARAIFLFCRGRLRNSNHRIPSYKQNYTYLCVLKRDTRSTMGSFQNKKAPHLRSLLRQLDKIARYQIIYGTYILRALVCFDQSTDR